MKRVVHDLRCRTVVASGAVLAVGLSLMGCSEAPKHARDVSKHPPAAVVRAQVVESQAWALIEEVMGTVRAQLQAQLEAKLSGRIVELPVVVGKRIKAGDLVARLDALEVSARLGQAKASMEQTERDWERATALFAQQAITRAEYDSIQARRDVAKGAVAEAEAMMSYVEVLAPFDGVVTMKWVDVGDFAMPGKPVVSVEDPSVVQIEAHVPQSIAPHVQLHTRIAARVDGVEGQLMGTVSEIAPAAAPDTRTVAIKVDLQQEAGLRSGQFARLLVPVGERQSIRVPVSAVLERGQLEIAFVVKSRHAQLRLVKTGKRLGDAIEIVSGLDAGELVVTDGAARLTDGQPVEVR